MKKIDRNLDMFHGSKEHLPVSCDVTSFKQQNRYIVANFIDKAHSAENSKFQKK